MNVRKTKADLSGDGRECLGKGVCACVVCCVCRHAGLKAQAIVGPAAV